MIEFRSLKTYQLIRKDVDLQLTPEQAEELLAKAPASAAPTCIRTKFNIRRSILKDPNIVPTRNGRPPGTKTILVIEPEPPGSKPEEVLPPEQMDQDIEPELQKIARDAVVFTDADPLQAYSSG